jgi:predicted amidohydrolase YtcJ
MKEQVANNQEDLLIRNGRIYTMDDADTVAQAVLIHGDVLPPSAR